MDTTTKFQRTAQTILEAGVGFSAWPTTRGSAALWVIQITDSMNHDQVRTVVSMSDVTIDFNKGAGTIQILGREDE